MKRALIVAALAAQLSCADHPVFTVAVGAGSVGLLSCEIQGASQGACGIITGIAAVGLGGLAWLVTHFADTSAHQLPDDDATALPDGTVRLHTHTALPPVMIDAGVVMDAAPGPGAQAPGSPAEQSPVPVPAPPVPGDAPPAAAS